MFARFVDVAVTPFSASLSARRGHVSGDEMMRAHACFILALARGMPFLLHNARAREEFCSHLRAAAAFPLPFVMLVRRFLSGYSSRLYRCYLLRELLTLLLLSYCADLSSLGEMNFNAFFVVGEI